MNEKIVLTAEGYDRVDGRSGMNLKETRTHVDSDTERRICATVKRN